MPAVGIMNLFVMAQLHKTNSASLAAGMFIFQEVNIVKYESYITDSVKLKFIPCYNMDSSKMDNSQIEF